MLKLKLVIWYLLYNFIQALPCVVVPTTTLVYSKTTDNKGETTTEKKIFRIIIKP